MNVTVSSFAVLRRSVNERILRSRAEKSHSTLPRVTDPFSGGPWYEEQVALEKRYDWLHCWTMVFTVVFTDKKEDMDKV